MLFDPRVCLVLKPEAFECMLQAKAQVQEAIDVEGGDARMQSAVEAGLLDARQRQKSGPDAGTSSAHEAQQERQPSSADVQSELQATSDEQLQSVIQEMQSRQQDSEHSQSEGSNGSDQRGADKIAAEPPNSRQS